MFSVLKLKIYYTLGVLYCVYFNLNPALCDEISDLVTKIEDQIRQAQNYVPRTDNSDIYTESLAATSSYYGQFDFIVVGAGSAGAVIAKRLSEYKFKTLLLEAGGKQDNMTNIPALWNIMINSNTNWGYETIPQRHCCLSSPNRRCKYPQGFSLGGTSAMNGPLYARGNKFDQDFWADFGVTGWGWQDTLPFFKKLENYNEIYGDLEYHGWKGPITLEYLRPSSYLVNVFLNANKEFYRVTKDYNGELQMGAGQTQMPKKNGQRMSTNRAYLTNYNPKYLTIETNAYVHKIIIKNYKAIGVEFIQNNNKNYQVLVKKEVIISAGAFNSPQILMLSGIGPKKELSNHNISVLANLPVGKNLEDHVGIFSNSFQSNITTAEPLKLLEEHVWEYLSGVGKLTETGLHAVSFISTEGNNSYPDIEFILNPRFLPFFSDLDKTVIMNNQVDGKFNIFMSLLHPKSKGSVTLQSNNPKDFPLIDLNSLSDPDDIEQLYKAFEYFRTLETTKAFKEIDAKLLKLNVPVCVTSFEEGTKDYWYCLIKQISCPMYHATGTCRMGAKGSSVVDSKLRVYGIKGLRVADNSIVPKTNSGHTNALAIMIGEKAAHIIQKDYLIK